MGKLVSNETPTPNGEPGMRDRDPELTMIHDTIDEVLPDNRQAPGRIVSSILDDFPERTEDDYWDDVVNMAHADEYSEDDLVYWSDPL